MSYEANDNSGGARARIEQSDRALVVEIASEDDDLKTVLAAASQQFDKRADDFCGISTAEVITLREDDDGVYR